MDTLSDTYGDYYIELMRDSRGLSSTHNELRELWFSGLDLANKEEVLFELEMLLKGLVCFGSISNHPGPRKREPVEGRHFDHELRVVHLCCERIAELCELLLIPEGEGQKNEDSIVSGPLEIVSSRLVREPFKQENPDQSLRLIHKAFSDITDIVGVISRLEKVPFRAFTGSVMIAAREIGRNVFFNPLLSLEFRSEYDHLQHIEILHIVYGAAPEGAQRAATLFFLALFRMLRYLRFANSYAQDPASSSLAAIPLAVAHSDGHTLSNFMRKKSKKWLSAEFEREVMTLSAHEIVDASAGLTQDYHVLHELGTRLRAIGDQLHLELRKTFEHQLDPLPQLLPAANFADQCHSAVKNLRDFLMQSVVQVAQIFKPELTGPALFDDFLDEAAAADRSRRDMWILSQILRGFLVKAAVAPETVNKWSGQSSYLFVREFIDYFRNLGYHLVRDSDFDRFEQFVRLSEDLSAADVIDQDSVEVFVRECEALREFLLNSFEALGNSTLLSDRQFDRHSAAETLRLYLDRG